MPEDRNDQSEDDVSLFVAVAGLKKFILVGLSSGF